MEISDDQITRMRRYPWLPGVHPDSKSGFLMKFYADAEKEECYFLVTDTVKVWAEGKSSTSDKSSTDKQERRFVRDMLQLIHAAHQLCRIADMEIVAEHGGKHADLSLRITTPSLDWEWRTFALRPSHASQVLSDLLIMPMLTQMSIMSMCAGGSDLDSFTKQLDKTSKTARVTRHTHLRAVFSKPTVACGIVRIMQMFEQVGQEFLRWSLLVFSCSRLIMALDPIVEDLEELEPVTAPLYFADPISDDEPEPEPEPHYASSNLRSSPAPLPDADGSATEDEDEDEGTGETQLQTQIDGSGKSQPSKRSQSSKYQSQSQSQSRPLMHMSRSNPHPSRSSAQPSMLGGRSISQPQVAGQKRRNAGSDSDSDEYERAEELLRRMNGATTSGAIGMKKKAGRRKF
ncbi:unnamed protein product [Rhizoctonia solani]|uniref:XLF-domain-containing protein n=1 Tax=Rhizoctonia solani TaxID=456999 RepID=A0A8H3DDP2_9AGAM|nr:unnamed protein product [Rhizoctonia solani]